MRIVLAPNALRGSLGAIEAARAMARGARRAAPSDAELIELPVADGGDGTGEILARALGAERRTARVHDPLGRPIDADWFEACGAPPAPDVAGPSAAAAARSLESGPTPASGRTAIIELAEASGLRRLSARERDPLVTSTRGAGELVAAALDAGCRRIIVGVGGSATVDAGAGLLQALGVDLLDASGLPLGPGGRELCRLDRIDRARLHPAAKGAEIIVACDVEHPALGDRGAAPTFGPQKGATEAGVATLSSALAHFCEVVERTTGVDVRTMPRGGAAGAAAAGLAGVLGATLVRGIDWVLAALRFDDVLEGELCAPLDAAARPHAGAPGARARRERASLVITAEGSADEQTLGHKGPLGVAEAARAHGVPVALLAGRIESGIARERFAAFDAIFSICRGPVPAQAAMRDAAALLEATTEEVVRLFCTAARRA